MYGWKTNGRTRAILSNYRGRNRTLWTKQEKQEAQTEYGKQCAKKKTFYDKDDDDEYAGADMREMQLSN